MLVEKNEEKRVALKLFFGIGRAWKLTNEEMISILGNPDEEAYSRWKNGDFDDVTDDVMNRISLIHGTYVALRTIFTSADQANSWVSRPNKSFGGMPAREVLARGRIEDLAQVRGLVQSEL